MSRTGSLAHGVVRGALALGACGALVAVAATVPTTDLTGGAADSAPLTGVTAVSAATLVCPGAELTGVEGLTDRDVPVTVGAAAPPAELVEDALGRALDEVPPLEGGVAALRVLGGKQPTLVEARGRTMTTGSAASSVLVSATGALTPGLVAAQQSTVAEGDDRGLTGTTCGSAAADQWLLAGGGDPGRQERLVLTNPSSNPVTVDVTLHGTDGLVDSPTGRGLVVPARGRTAVLLDSISATETTPAVHVVSTGGQVHAVLNDHWVDGTLAAGGDDVPRSADPAKDQVLPGVALWGTSSSSSVRVAVPGSQEAVLELRALTLDGPRALGSGGVTRVAGGSVVDVPLAGLAYGTYAIQVRADVPVVASAVSIRRPSASVGDLAWTTATAPINHLAGTPLLPVDGAARALTLASSGGAREVEVVTTDDRGKATTRRASVPADSVVSLDLGQNRAVWVAPVSGEGDLRAAVLTAIGKDQSAMISTSPLVDTPLTSQPVDLVAVASR